MNRNRLSILAAMTCAIWLLMSVGAVVILIAGTAWAMSTVMYEAVTA